MKSNKELGELYGELDLSLREARKTKPTENITVALYKLDLASSVVLVSALLDKIPEQEQKEIMESFSNYQKELI